MTNLNMVWVVEMRNDQGHFEATVGVGLTRKHGRCELADWQARYPDDTFRLRCYVRRSQ